MSDETCSFPDCWRKLRVKSVALCNAHYIQHRTGQDLRPLNPPPDKDGATGECSFDGCDRKRVAKRLCVSHYKMHRTGKPLAPLQPRDPGEWGQWRPDRHGYMRRLKHVDGIRYSQLQHRYVMEQYLGRNLLPHENVHHINGDRADNRIENLELWSTSQPKGQRVADKLAWAREIVALYGGRDS